MMRKDFILPLDRERLFSFFIVFFFFFSFGLIFNNWLVETDLQWHLKVGEIIWNTGQFPDRDIFSYTMAGSPWIAKEWLSQLIFYGVFYFFNWSGLVIFSSAIVSSAITILFSYFAFYWKFPPLFSFVICLLIFIPLTKVVRPQIFMFLLMAITLILLDIAIINKKLPSFGLLIVAIFWANLHASQPLIFVFLAFFALEMLYFMPRSAWLKFIFQFGCFSFLILTASGVTPYGFEPLAYALNFVRSGIENLIIEWRSYFDLVGDFGIGDYLYFMIIPIEILGLAILIFARRPIQWPRIVAIVFFLVVGLKHFRFLQVFCFYASFVTFSASQSYFDRNHWFGIARRADKKMLAILTACSVIFIVTAVHVFPWSPKDRVYPIKALRAAEAYGVQGRVLNSYDLGGFLIFQDVKTFIDGRAELFLDKIVPEIEGAIKSTDPHQLNSLLQKYDISWTFFMTGLDDDKRFSTLSGWKKIYGDESAVVYVRE